ncbi:hypothetical protein [Staphylococcus epidermidis]|nr:hypothetical protein [Staphylococcus epidermidis]
MGKGNKIVVLEYIGVFVGDGGGVKRRKLSMGAGKGRGISVNNLRNGVV